MIANTDSIARGSDSYQQISLNYHHNLPGSMPGTISIADLAKPPEINLIDYNQIYTPREFEVLVSGSQGANS